MNLVYRINRPEMQPLKVLLFSKKEITITSLCRGITAAVGKKVITKW